MSSTPREFADAELEDDEEDEVELKPIPPPNNPPMELITLILTQPDLEKLTMTKVDPANTNIRTIREFLHKKYYKGNDIPRMEQRQLLYRTKPIFDSLEGDYNVDDAKTLADHGLIKDQTVIDLSKMHVHVVSPSDKKSMMINNIDPMNDVIFDMKKLAFADGYPSEKLRLLHKEANHKEIKKTQNEVSFFQCGVKHNHTLILEWPKIVIKIKLPIIIADDNDDDNNNNTKREIIHDPETGRSFQLVDLTTQAELDKVQIIHDFILERTGIPFEQQTLISNPTTTKKSGKRPKTRKLKSPLKVIADYKIEENDIIELEPITVKVNLVGGTTGNAQTTLEPVFPNDTIEYIKDQIQEGKGEADAIPSIPSTNQSLRKTKDGKELKLDQKTLYEEGIQHLDELDMEKTKITIKVKLPDNTSGSRTGGRIIEIGINPKLDDVEAIKDQLADKTGLPKEFLPPLTYKGERMGDDDDDKEKKKLAEYNIIENDVIDMEPMKLNVNVVGSGDTICIDDIDPFSDTIGDIKKKLGPDDLDILPVDKQRLLFKDVDLDEGDDDDEPSSRRLFECDIKNLDTVDLEKSQIDIKIKQPNGEILELEKVDPRKDTVEAIEEFLSDEYYRGKDKDGTIPDDQLRPLKYEGEKMAMKDNTKSLRDYGIKDDGKVVEMEPMKIHVIVGRPDGSGSSKSETLENVDPMNDKIQDAKAVGATEDIPVDMLILRHKESNMKEIEDRDDKASFHDNGVKEGDTLVILRKPITIRVKLPKGCQIKENDDDDGVEVIRGSKDSAPMLSIKVDPDADDLDAIRERIFDYVGVPIDSQKLIKFFNDDDGNDEDALSKDRLDVPGDTKLSAPGLNLVDNCTIELAPMTINIKTERGETIPLKVLPSDTIEDVKKKLAQDKISIPHYKQRLLKQDCIEIGGDEDNEKSNGSDKSTLMELGVEDGDTLSVEKSKITLKVNMPSGIDDIEVLIDPRNDDVDQIRQFIFDATGLPKEYQQRFKFDSQLLDDGFKDVVDADGDDSDEDGSDDGAKKKKKQTLADFKFKEFDCITLDAVRVYIMRIPEKEQFVIEGIDLINNILQDLKKRIAAEINVPSFKQRLLNSKTDEEYVGNKDSTEKLRVYGIKDGDVINLEKLKVNLRIILPNLDELHLTVDPRKDDLQKVRDHIFKKYYNKRKIPKKDLRTMLRGATKVLDDEPGEKKLIEFGINNDDEYVKLKPCYITLETPTKVIYCPNADPFHDTLKGLTKFLEHLKVPVDGCHIVYKKKKMKDYKSVLYDLKIGDESKLTFVKK